MLALSSSSPTSCSQTHPDIGLVALDQDPEKALRLVARLNEESPDCSILVVSSSTDGGLILKAMRAGAKEFLARPVQIEDLLDALGRHQRTALWPR